MDMNEFAEIMKQSQIAGKNKVKIIYRLFQAVGAKGAGIEKSKQSPSDSTIQKWLSNIGNKPKGMEYFQNSQIENKEVAHKFLRDTVDRDSWIKLRDLFKEWHENKPDDEGFYINTETDDFETFSTSFWRQFASFFVALRMWDGAEEQYFEMEGIQKKLPNSFANEMVRVFKENYIHYKVYEFIPKNIEDIINSLYIYCEILNEGVKLMTQEGDVDDFSTVYQFKKMYCRLCPEFDYFIFHAADHHKVFWELKTQKELMILKFDEDFDYNMMSINTWEEKSFKYAIANQDNFDEQFDDDTLIWKECQGEIIIFAIDTPLDGDYSVIEDCHMLIDRMLELHSSIDEFIAVINEKIIKKYENVIFDNNSRLLYNNIKLYRKSLKNFKKYLSKFEGLQKEKDKYFADQVLINTFSVYQTFGDYDASPKPKFPFSECYLKPKEANEVILNLRRYHERLLELYIEISSYE